jgi:hypothetical protein
LTFSLWKTPRTVWEETSILTAGTNPTDSATFPVFAV